MAIFEDISFEYKGKEFKIKSNKVMRLICTIEDIITLGELTTGPKFSKLAEAYTAALTYAGADVEIEEVYASLFGNGSKERVSATITNLIMMMLPPDTYNPKIKDEESGKPQAE